MRGKKAVLNKKQLKLFRGLVAEGRSWEDISVTLHEQTGAEYIASTYYRMARKLGLKKKQTRTSSRASFNWTPIRINRLRTLVHKHDLSSGIKKFQLEFPAAPQREACVRALQRVGEKLAAPGPSFKLTPDQRLLRSLRSGYKTIPEHADKASVTVDQLLELLDQFTKQRQLIEWDGVRVRVTKQPQFERKTTVIPLERFEGSTFRFAAISDTHLNSHYERLDCLYAFYEIVKKEGIHYVLHSGNPIDGYADRINRGQVRYVEFDAQSKYLAEMYPRQDGVTTMFITGECHEGWYAKQITTNVGLRMQDDAMRIGRTDLKYLGHVEHDVRLGGPGGPSIRLFHPGGGQSAYALSYKLQKVIESWTGGEKPDMVLVGHYHKSFYMDYRNVPAFLVGCMQDQTPYMRGRHIQAMVAGWLITVTLDPVTGAFVRVQPEEIRFFEKSYYSIPTHKDWKYIWTADRVVKPVMEKM